MSTQTPHDSFFKETIGRIEVAENFLINYLPESIRNSVDTKTLVPQKDSFIDKELNETFADLLFKADIDGEEGYIYFLFEHKSYTRKDVSLQLLKYMIAIWEAKVKNEKEYKLPVILPLLIYHGKEQWNAGNTLGNIIKGYDGLPNDIKKYIPNYEYLLYDISKYTDDEIKGNAYIRIMLTVLRDIFIKDEAEMDKTFTKAAEYIKELDDRQSGIEYFETMMRYIFSVKVDLTKETANKILGQLETTYPEGGELLMTLAQVLKEEGKEEGLMKGMERGLERGLELGAKQEKLEIARNALKEGMEIDLVVKFTRLSKREIEAIIKEMDNE